MVWDVATGKECPVPAGLSHVQCVAFSPDSGTAAAAGEDGVVRLWEPASGLRKGHLAGHTDAVEALCFHSNGQTLASASRDHTVRLWAWQHQQQPQVAVIPNPQQQPHVIVIPKQAWVQSLACSRDGTVLALGLNNEETVIIRDPAGNWAREPEPLAAIAGGAAPGVDSVESGGIVAFAPDENLLAIGRRDGTISVWEVGQGRR
jgi:WD40 repeat protein